MRRYFRESVFLSFLGHLAVFSIFALSFGSRIPRADFAAVSFWGTVLKGAEVTPPSAQRKSSSIFKAAHLSGEMMPKMAPAAKAPVRDYYAKPFSAVLPDSAKSVLPNILFPLPEFKQKGEPAILFHPLLPYDFGLYFRDRQIAHVELIFNIESHSLRNYPVVKRRISSGNLEVDLLCMRYIEHYLSIERERFARNKWQTVKIDLSEARPQRRALIND